MVNAKLKQAVRMQYKWVSSYPYVKSSISQSDVIDFCITSNLNYQKVSELCDMIIALEREGYLIEE